MDPEAIWYECSPYVYLLGGLVCLITANSVVSVISGVLLVTAAATILRLRWLHRRPAKGKIHWPVRKTPLGKHQASKIRKH